MSKNHVIFFQNRTLIGGLCDLFLYIYFLFFQVILLKHPSLFSNISLHLKVLMKVY